VHLRYIHAMDIEGDVHVSRKSVLTENSRSAKINELISIATSAVAQKPCQVPWYLERNVLEHKKQQR